MLPEEAIGVMFFINYVLGVIIHPSAALSVISANSLSLLRESMAQCKKLKKFFVPQNVNCTESTCAGILLARA